ncbi:MAG: methyltransferase [Actinomycetia bacterium]|nr:methyltransferase [Actinomycetes bacterium]
MPGPKFDESELEVVFTLPENPRMKAVDIFKYPVTSAEAVRALYNREPIWQISGLDSKFFSPAVYPDNVARAFVYEATPFDNTTQGGGKDMFGVEWEYVPLVNGSMVKPGQPLFSDANEWKSKLKKPNIASWDWAGSAAANNGTYLTPQTWNNCWLLNGWFERMISWMDFDNAAVALIDPDQKEAVQEMLEWLTDVYIELADKFIETYPGIDEFYVHDDWGAQKDTFFSPEVGREMLVPSMKRFVKHLHDQGFVVELHSCGANEKQIENFIEMGFDSWAPMSAINDTVMLYEKYGDQIVIGVAAKPFAADASEAEQRARAREYVEMFCKPNKPSMLSFDTMSMLTPAFREELYKCSRIAYCG